MIKGKQDYRLFEHTADVGVEVRAGEITQLFERSAAAMFDQVVDLESVSAALGPVLGPIEIVVELEPAELDLLLAHWLGELLSRAMAEGLVLGAFDVERIDAAGLVGRAWGEAIDPARHRIKGEVKAVTYHHLRVEEDDSGWRAQFILDL